MRTTIALTIALVLFAGTCLAAPHKVKSERSITEKHAAKIDAKLGKRIEKVLADAEIEKIDKMNASQLAKTVQELAWIVQVLAGQVRPEVVPDDANVKNGK